MVHEIRYAVRNLRRAPGFTAVIIVTLALGIGANTAIFSIVNALLLNPLPYKDPSRLMLVTFDNGQPSGFQTWPYPKYAAFSAEQRSFESTAAFAPLSVVLRAGGEPERVEGEIVTATYFPLLGVTASLGRVFLPEEDRAVGQAPVAVLSDALWRRQFRADPGAVGRNITIRDRQYEIVGVMPPSFRGQSGTAEIWVPTMMGEHLMNKGMVTGAFSWWIRVLARLKHDVTEAQAESAMPALSDRVSALAPAMTTLALNRDGKQMLTLVPFKSTKVDPDVSRSFVLLLVAVGFVLLIACANTANLLLGRAVARQREFAVRLALGAAPGALVRQVAIESVLLAGAAGAVALGVAALTLDWLTTARPWNATGYWSQYAKTFEYFTFSLEPRVLAFNFAVSGAVGLLFGLAPAWHAGRSNLTDALKQGSGASAGGFSPIRRFSARAALVLTEIAFSLILLVAAGLMIKSFARVSTADLGFDGRQVITMTAGITGRRPPSFYQDLVQRLQSLPGVQHAALSQARPLAAGGWTGPADVVLADGTESNVDAMLNVVTNGFFETFGMRVVQGRGFTEQDTGAERVAVVSRSLAEAVWPGMDPIGRRIHSDLYGNVKETGWARVVGVVDHVKYGPIEEPGTVTLYMSASQPPKSSQMMSMAPTLIALRTAVDPSSVVSAVRAQVQALDPSTAIYDVATMSERMAKVTSRYRYSTLLMGAVALLALVLAAMGTYGVMAYAVATRTREIGIRMALGARPADVLALVVGGGLALASAGIALGMAGAFIAVRALGAMLYGVSPADPVMFVLIPLLMAMVAGVASYLPARRAMRVDPVVALRVE